MAGLLDLLSGRSSDIYGAGLLTPEQRGGIGNIGLLALAGKLGQLAGPSFSPVPDFGAALGQAAGAYGASQEGAGTAALNAILTGQKGRKLEQELDYYKQLGPVLGKLAGQWPGADGGTAATPGAGSTGGGAAAPLGAGGGGPGRMSYDQVLQLVLAKGFPADKAPIMAATIMAESGGNPSAANLNPSDPGGSYGLTQINAGAHGPKAKEALGNPDRAVELAYDISKGGTDFTPWSAYKSGAYKRFLPQGGAAPTAAAPAGGGGLLNLPQVPNFSSRLGGAPLADAGDTSTPADVLPNRVGRFAGVAPGTPVNSRGFPYNPEITDPAVAARVAQSMAAIKQAQQSGVPWAAPRESSGSSAAAPADIYAGTDAPRGPAGNLGPPGPQGEVVVPIPPRPAPPPLAIPDLPPQAAAALAQAAPGLLMPGGGLLPRGGGAIPGMPPALAMPSDDPRLQLGPLAPTPAPAAAAPAAAGPGLLSPPGAPPIPRGANPAFDAYLRNLATAGTLAEGAGLKNVFGPMIDALKASPSFQAELERARKTIELQYAPALKEAEKGVELRYAEPLAAATGRGQLPSKVAELEVKSRLDNLAAGRVWDADKGQFVSPPGYVDTLKEQERAKAEGSKSQDTTEVMVRGADGRDYKQMIPQTDLAQKLREQPPAIPGQPVAPGTIVGARQAGPLDTLGVDTLKEAGVAAQGAYKRIQDYGQLAQAAQGFTTGPTTEKWFEVKRYLKDLGVISGTEVPDQEIFQLAQRRLQAAAAPKGQGATSDYERSLFSSALAGMATSRKGLARAIAIANRLDQYDVQVAQIHEDVARTNRGYPDYLEVQRRLRELGPPLSEGEKAALTAVSSGATPSAVSPAAPAAGVQPAPAGSIRTPYGTITPRQ